MVRSIGDREGHQVLVTEHAALPVHDVETDAVEAVVHQVARDAPDLAVKPWRPRGGVQRTRVEHQ